MVNAVFGQKVSQSQGFLTDGTRIPTTMVSVIGNSVVSIKQKDKHGYTALQVGFGITKRANKSHKGQVKGADQKTAPAFFKEVRLSDSDTDQLPQVGDSINAADVLKPGDIVDVIGISKGKGYAGVVKRHNFKGGPRTHGQSDRERAPGSIGQTTTPGRVYRGKRMSGRMGQDRVTMKNLLVVDVTADGVLLKGLVPGGKNTVIMIRKIGENTKFVGLYKPTVAESTNEQESSKDVPVEQATEVVQTEETTVADSSETVQTATEIVEGEKSDAK